MRIPLFSNSAEKHKDDLRNCLLVLSFAFAALLALLFLADKADSFGFVMVLGVPLYVGAIIGHSGRISQAWKVTAVVTLLVGVLASLVLWDIAGLLCTTIAAAILIVPMLLGATLGHYFQRWQRAHDANRHSVTAVVLLFIALAGSLVAERHLTPVSEIETVTTTRVLDLSPERSWQSVVFYEEVGLEPPLLTRIGLPYPLRTEGGAHELGSLTRCVYSTGYLVKRITALEPMKKLAFDVIEQHGVEDQSFELVSGSFTFERVADGQTRVVLETSYRPLLQARFYWRPFEERLAHVLHDYVLDAMAAQPQLQTLVAKR